MAVYCLQAGPDRHIKIGWATNVEARMRVLQTGSPYLLELIAQADGEIGVEKAIQRSLSADALHGEWFRPSQDVLDMVADIAAGRVRRRADVVVRASRHDARSFRGVALTRAVNVVGSASALAAKLGITREAVSQWRRVPAERVIAVEAATDMAVLRSQLRPDLYPAEREKAVA